MRKRVGIYGVTDETVQLVPLLEANPGVEIALLFDADLAAARARLGSLDLALAGSVEGLLTDDAGALERAGLQAVVDAGEGARFAARFPLLREHGIEIVSPLTARLLWGYGGSQRDRKAELLQALHEVVESVDLAIDADELFERMLEIAITTTGADRGSLMLLDADTRELRIRVAVGVERELWPKIRVPVGVGIAGRVAEDGRSVLLRGRADRQAFRIVHERSDVESAICAPLLHEGAVIGVLNLHHSAEPDAFGQADLEFVEQLARLDARIIARAQEHGALREKAARYAMARELGDILERRSPLADRLQALCRYVAASVGDGIANVYLCEEDDEELHLAATSLAGGGFGSEYRVRIGAGLDGGAARTRRPALLHDAAGRIAYAALPLVSGDLLVGTLSVQAGARPFETATLEQIAGAAADAVARSAREARISARATKASAINETGIRLISTTDTAEVVQLAASSAAMILEADHAILRLRDEETGRFVIRSYFGSADGRLQEKLFQLDKRVSVDAIKRRAPVLLRELAADPGLADFAPDVRSALAVPLGRDGRVVGTLSLYDRIAADGFYAGVFRQEDVSTLERFASYVERAVTNARLYASVRRHKSFDDETDLPNAAYLERRLEEEIVRAQGRDGALAVVGCRIEGFAALATAAGERHATRVVRAVAAALGRSVRGFDLVARTGDAEFCVMLPDPPPPAEDTISALARNVAEEIAKDDALNAPGRIALAFGFAVYPADGADRAALLSAAALPRIRMV